jgi:hypothetical protein
MWVMLAIMGITTQKDSSIARFRHRRCLLGTRAARLVSNTKARLRKMHIRVPGTPTYEPRKIFTSTSQRPLPSHQLMISSVGQMNALTMLKILRTRNQHIREIHGKFLFFQCRTRGGRLIKIARRESACKATV